MKYKAYASSAICSPSLWAMFPYVKHHNEKSPLIKHQFADLLIQHLNDSEKENLGNCRKVKKQLLQTNAVGPGVN